MSIKLSSLIEKKEYVCPVCEGKIVYRCRCSGPHSIEDLQKGHGCKCENGHRFSGNLVLENDMWDGNLIGTSTHSGGIVTPGTATFHSPDASQNPSNFMQSSQNKVDFYNSPGMPPSKEDIALLKKTVTPDEIIAGIDYEMKKMVIKDMSRAKSEVVKNLKKDPKYYSELHMLAIDDGGLDESIKSMSMEQLIKEASDVFESPAKTKYVNVDVFQDHKSNYAYTINAKKYTENIGTYEKYDIYQFKTGKSSIVDLFVYGDYTIAFFQYNIDNGIMIEQKVWQDATAMGLARELIWKYYLNKFNGILSDAVHTDFGEKYWKKLIDGALKSGMNVYVLKNGNQKIKINNISEADKYYNSASYSFLIIKNDSNLNEIVKPAKESDIDPKEVMMGIEVEMEHTDDKKEAKKIALQHLAEDPKYYTKMKLCGIKEKIEEVVGSEDEDIFSPESKACGIEEFMTFFNEATSEQINKFNEFWNNNDLKGAWKYILSVLKSMGKLNIHQQPQKQSLYETKEATKSLLDSMINDRLNRKPEVNKTLVDAFNETREKRNSHLRFYESKNVNLSEKLRKDVS